MKKLIAVFLAVSAFVAPASTQIEIQSVTAKQDTQNGVVDVAVMLQGEVSEVAKVECSFVAVNVENGAAVSIEHITRSGDDEIAGSVWTRKFIWDAKSDVGTVKVDDVALTVRAKISIGVGGVQLWENGPYWAECNVGATKPEEFGYYFWWGDTVGYKRLDDNWVAVDGIRSQFSFDGKNCPTYGMNDAKLKSLGYIDSVGNLAVEHDAATAHLCATWRMPTDEEFSRLVTDCDTELTTCNGVSGRIVKGRGAYAAQSIFLPAAGYGYKNDLLGGGSFGVYWSSTLASGDSIAAWGLIIDSGKCRQYYGYREDGMPIRPLRGCAETICERTVHLQVDFRGDSYSYVHNQEGITITGIVSSSRNVSIPEVIDGFAVTGIGRIEANEIELIRIPSTVKEIEFAAFCHMGELSAITVDPANPKYGSINGALYDKTTCEIIECPLSMETMLIPEGFKSIADCAFESCKKLQSITIPLSLKNIGNCAFRGCWSLLSVGNVDLSHWCSLSIGGDGANPLSRLKGLEMNERVCTDIQIPDGVSNICANAFLMCSWLTSVSFPDSVKKIGEDAFCGCKGLKIVALPFGMKTVGGGAFSSCTSLESIEIPSSVSEIGRYAFRGCDSLKKVFVDAGESGRIRYLLAESGVDVEGIDFIEGESRTPPDGRYRDEINGVVWSYLIHDGEACVGGGEQAVSVYSGSVSIPVKLGNCPATSIGAGAFDCTYLDSIFIPASIVQIDRAAFPHGDQLPVFVVDENNSSYKSEDGMLLSKSGVLICGVDRPSVNVPNDVVRIGDKAFSSCQKLVTLSLPNGLREIGNESFSWCDQLREIKLPSGLTNIAERAFYFCRGLESISFPSNLTQLGEGAFSACVNLKEVEVPSGVTLICKSVFLGCSKLNSLFLPAGLIGIDNSAFSGCIDLDSLEIPKGVREIGSGAFRDCPLKVISIPRSVVKIGAEAFTLGSIKTTITVEAGDLKRVKSLLSDAGVNISRVTFIEEGRGPGSWTDPKTGLTWEYCDYYYFDWDEETQDGDYVCDGGITIIKVSPNPVGVLQIPASIYGRPVRSVDQPWCYGNLEYYDWGYDDEEFLNYCDELTEVIFPDTIREIGPDMVRYCPNLTSVYLPEGLISIGKYSFMDCGLTSIEYPSTLQSDISYIWKSPIVSASIRGGNNDYFLFEDGGMYSTGDDYSDGVIQYGAVKHGKLIGSCRNIQTLSVREGCVQLRYDTLMSSLARSVFLPKSLKMGDGHAICHNQYLVSVCFSGRPIAIDGSSDFYNDCPNVTTYVPRNMGWENIVLTGIWQGRPIKFLDEYVPEPVEGGFLPELSMSSSEDDVRVAFAGAVDQRIKKNITSAGAYQAFRQWATDIGVQKVQVSPQAWTSFALNLNNLLPSELAESDLKVEAFTPSLTEGLFDFTVSVKDAQIGSNAYVEYIKTIFGVEGSPTLDSAAFKQDSVTVKFTNPMNGKLKLSAGPADKSSKAFFMKMKIKE